MKQKTMLMSKTKDEAGLMDDLDKIQKPTPVGEVTPELASRLGSGHTVGKILIGPTNVDHMKKEHPEDYAKYSSCLEDILSSPDYVGTNPHNGSLQFIKEYPPDQVLVAVRVTPAGAYFARSLYQISAQKFENYKTSGRLIDMKN